MGLTTCPKCGETISEKATVCPHCSSGVSKDNIIICEDCGNEYDISMETCPNCGCPNLTVKQKQKKHKGVNTFIIVFALIVVGVLGMVISQKEKEREYYSNMKAVSFMMLDGAVKAENAGNLIKSVWYNVIYEKRDSETDQYTMENGKFVDDFNDALSELFANENFRNSISEIKNNQSEVIDLMQQLKNPPKKYEEAYSVLMVYYDNYFEMTKTVINPTGNFIIFLEKFNTYDNNTVDSFEKMILYLD